MANLVVQKTQMAALNYNNTNHKSLRSETAESFDRRMQDSVIDINGVVGPSRDLYSEAATIELIELKKKRQWDQTYLMQHNQKDKRYC